MPVNKGLTKKVVVYLYNGVLCSKKRIVKCLHVDVELFLRNIVKVKKNWGQNSYHHVQWGGESKCVVCTHTYTYIHTFA